MHENNLTHYLKPKTLDLLSLSEAQAGDIREKFTKWSKKIIALGEKQQWLYADRLLQQLLVAKVYIDFIGTEVDINSDWDEFRDEIPCLGVDCSLQLDSYLQEADWEKARVKLRSIIWFIEQTRKKDFAVAPQFLDWVINQGLILTQACLIHEEWEHPENCLRILNKINHPPLRFNTQKRLHQELSMLFPGEDNNIPQDFHNNLVKVDEGNLKEITELYTPLINTFHSVSFNAAKRQYSETGRYRHLPIIPQVYRKKLQKLWNKVENSNDPQSYTEQWSIFMQQHLPPFLHANPSLIDIPWLLLPPPDEIRLSLKPYHRNNMESKEIDAQDTLPQYNFAWARFWLHHLGWNLQTQRNEETSHKLFKQFKDILRQVGTSDFNSLQQYALIGTALHYLQPQQLLDIELENGQTVKRFLLQKADEYHLQLQPEELDESSGIKLFIANLAQNEWEEYIKIQFGQNQRPLQADTLVNQNHSHSNQNDQKESTGKLNDCDNHAVLFYEVIHDSGNLPNILKRALERGDYTTVSIIVGLGYGADFLLNTDNLCYRTALVFASELDHLDVVKLLLDHDGAYDMPAEDRRLTVKNVIKQLVLNNRELSQDELWIIDVLITRNTSEEFQKELKKQALHTIIKVYKAHQDINPPHQLTHHLALENFFNLIQANDVDNIHSFLRQFAQPWDNSNHTIIPCLINERIDEAGNTPLMLTIQRNNEKWVLYLIAYGADVFIKNKVGKTALMLAIEQGHWGFARGLFAAQLKQRIQLAYLLEEENWERYYTVLLAPETKNQTRYHYELYYRIRDEGNGLEGLLDEVNTQITYLQKKQSLFGPLLDCLLSSKPSYILIDQLLDDCKQLRHNLIAQQPIEESLGASSGFVKLCKKNSTAMSCFLGIIVGGTLGGVFAPVILGSLLSGWPIYLVGASSGGFLLGLLSAGVSFFCKSCCLHGDPSLRESIVSSDTDEKEAVNNHSATDTLINVRSPNSRKSKPSDHHTDRQSHQRSMSGGYGTFYHHSDRNDNDQPVTHSVRQTYIQADSGEAPLQTNAPSGLSSH